MLLELTLTRYIVYTVQYTVCVQKGEIGTGM